MSDTLQAALDRHFGFPGFRPGQAESISALLAGKHTLAVMPTGAGKSLIYQLCALQLPGVTLVISPLIALMQDQVDGLSRRGIPATFINSALGGQEQLRRLEGMSAEDFRLVYVAPERLRSVKFREALAKVTVSLVAVDEAHCISQWGHDFRPDYLHIAAARETMGSPVTAALTATATPRVQDDIIRLLGLADAERIVTGFNRRNLVLSISYAVDAEHKFRRLRDELLAVKDGASIVYVGTRRDAEEVADFIREVVGVPVDHYHAGMETDARTRVQSAFMAGKLPVVVATNAFGMGIDRPDVRLVAHFTMPGTLEAYYQEAGRAGRDGLPAKAVLIYSPQDRALQEWFIQNDAPTLEELRGIHRTLKGWNRDEGWVSLPDISLATGLYETRVRVGLAQLEAAGVVRHIGDGGGRMLLRVEAWKEEAVQGSAEDAEERRLARMAQLNQVVAYAEANDCRRRRLLDHFGDTGPVDADECCDNCLAGREIAEEGKRRGDSAKLPPSALAALRILDTVRRLRWEVGRIKLAQVLTGARRKDLRQFGYDKVKHYGKLREYSQEQVGDLIDQLIEQGYLKVIGGDLPVIRMTPKGTSALAKRAEIALQLPRPVFAVDAGGRRMKNEAEDEGDTEASGTGDVGAFLKRVHPKPLVGPWHSGWALGFHSRFDGGDWSRSGVGELAYRLKYKSDESALKPLMEHIYVLCREHRELCDVDAIVPIPPSVQRPFDPVRLVADAAGSGLGLPVSEALVRVRKTAPQKEMRTLAQKQANVRGAFAVRGDLRGRKVLVIDDLYDSGATLAEAFRVLTQAGVEQVRVLTLTRTIHSDA